MQEAKVKLKKVLVARICYVYTQSIVSHALVLPCISSPVNKGYYFVVKVYGIGIIHGV
jgi:hypothetical protein